MIKVPLNQLSLDNLIQITNEQVILDNRSDNLFISDDQKHEMIKLLYKEIYSLEVYVYEMDEEDNVLDIFIISYIISGDSDLFISKLGLDLDSIEYLKEQKYLKYPFKYPFK